jgi:phospholipase D1/2
MRTLIDKSRRFIYIENQYFVSDFGEEAARDARLSSAARFIDKYPDGKSQNDSARILARMDSHSKHYAISPDVLKPPSNGIVKALLDRIWQSARSKSPFHVYITLPVHPEGLLTDATIATQIYWTMQTISFGSHSLLNGVRRIIKARELLRANDHDYERALEEGNNEYEDVDLSLCEEFVTLLNLRNWAKLGDRYVSEQIYVHSKTMVVDDLYALIGSANINDRSLLGERDSELAVLVMDGDTLRADVNGAGSHRVVRKFAHQLRIDIWKKLFGFTDGKRPATELAKAIEQPGSADSWKAIQKRAAQNAALFEAAFPWTPRNWTVNRRGSKTFASILPTWDAFAAAPTDASWGNLGQLSSPMPFQPEFWSKPRQQAGAANLEQVRGFISALPFMWGQGENNRFEFPTDLVAENSDVAPQRENQSGDTTGDVG